MFNRLKAHAAKIAAKAAAAAIGRIAEKLAGEVPPGVGVETNERGIVMIGKRIKRRLIEEARLRAIAALAKAIGGKATP